MRNSQLTKWGQGLVGLAALVAVLELLPRVGVVSERYMPPFSTMMQTLLDELGQSEF